MGASTDPSSQPGGASDPGLDFVAAWAALVHLLASHSASHPAVGRVVSAALAAREACAAAEPLRVHFTRDELRVGGREHPLTPGSEAARLGEHLESCGVAGALFEPGLRAASLVSLARQVLEGSRRAAHEPDFEHWCGEPVEHVHVLQRRFVDLFEGADGAGSTPRSLRRAVEALPEGALDHPQVASEHMLALVRGELDASDDDDVAALEVELAALPAAAHDPHLLAPLESPPECLGVYLHHLLELDDEAEATRLQPTLAGMLRAAGPAEHQVLESYVAPLCVEAPAPADERYRRRLTGFLCDFDLTAVLAEHGAFGLDLAVECFPTDLGLWLDGLDLEREPDHARACELFERVGAEAVLRAGQVVVDAAGLARPERAAALLARPHQALVPLARLLLARGVPRLTRQVASFVRALAPDAPEAAPLALLDDDELPAEVLAGLLDPPRTDTAHASLRRRVAECLCEHLERPALDAAEAERRLALARSLAEFPEVRARLAQLHARELCPGGDARLAEALGETLTQGGEA